MKKEILNVKGLEIQPDSSWIERLGKLKSWIVLG